MHLAALLALRCPPGAGVSPDVDSLFELIDTLPLQPGQETIPGISALHSVHAIIDPFEEIYSTTMARLPVGTG